MLIIDDEADIRESLETLLELEGYTVDTAETGEEGLARLAERHVTTWCCSILLCPTAPAWKCWPTSASAIRSRPSS